MFVALEDELVTVYSRGLWRWLSRRVFRHRCLAAQWLGRRTIRRAQCRAERLHTRMRRNLLKIDAYLEVTLAFSGRPE
jgi:hypothetical protein